MAYQETIEGQDVTACEIRSWLEREVGANLDAIQRQRNSLNESTRHLFPVWNCGDLVTLLGEYNRLSSKAAETACRRGLV